MIAITEKEQKLMTLALDHAAAEGEIQNAAVMFFRSLRDRGVTGEMALQKPMQPVQVVQSWTFSTGGWSTEVRTW